VEAAHTLPREVSVAGTGEGDLSGSRQLSTEAEHTLPLALGDYPE